MGVWGLVDGAGVGGGSGGEGVAEWVVVRVGTNKHDDTIITHKRNGSQISTLLIIFYECTSPSV